MKKLKDAIEDKAVILGAVGIGIALVQVIYIMIRQKILSLFLFIIFAKNLLLNFDFS